MKDERSNYRQRTRVGLGSGCGFAIWVTSMFLPRSAARLLLGALVVSAAFVATESYAKDVVSVGENGRIVEGSFFGMHVRYGATQTPWPNVPFHSWRVITPGTAWFGLQPERGKWNFAELDRSVAVAERHGIEILLTLGQTPKWAAARPGEIVQNGPGASSEPARMEDWENYIRTVARRYRGKIKYYELWNEPRFREVYPYRVMPGFTGYAAQMVEMGRVARRVLQQEDPKAVLISPAIDAGLSHVEQWFRSGGGDVAPILGYHFYVRPPEKMVSLYRDLRTITKRYGYPTMPIWNTESGYLVYNPEQPSAQFRPGSSDVFGQLLTPDELAAYMVRAHILMAAAGLDRFYWYSWDIDDMGLTRSSGRTPMIGSVAYKTMLDWLRGATISMCATDNDKTWICHLRRNGKEAFVVWNTDGEIPFEIPKDMQVGEVETIDGKTMLVRLGPIRIGMTPVLLKAKGVRWRPSPLVINR